MKALVIGAGISIQENKFKQLDEIAKNFDGVVVASDRMLIECLRHGIKPDKIVVCTCEYFPPKDYDSLLGRFKIFYNYQLIRKNAKNIECWLACTVDPALKKYIEDVGFKMNYCHRFGKVCEFKPPSQSLDIKTGGNTGVYCEQIAVHALHCDPVAMVGIDLEVSQWDKDYSNFTAWNLELNCSKRDIANDFFDKQITVYNTSKASRLYGKGIKYKSLSEFIEL